MYFVVYFLPFGLDGNADIKNVNTNIVASNIKLDLSKFKRPGISIYEYDVNDIRIPVDDVLVEHINLLYKLIGSDMTWERYMNMSQQDIKRLNRDLKINKIVE